MKKLIAVPVVAVIVAVIAAVGAASAAGFAGGVSAGPLQVGQTNDLECAQSAKVVEWGYNDHLSTPNVVDARVLLTDAENLKSVRISADPGFDGQAIGSINWPSPDPVVALPHAAPPPRLLLTPHLPRRSRRSATC